MPCQSGFPQEKMAKMYLLAHYAGILPKPEALSLAELLPEFSWEKVPVEDITVDASLI